MAECLCGCGRETITPDHTDNSKGWIKGEPRPYVRGHHPRDRVSKGYVTTNGYREFSFKRRRILEHRLVTGAKPGEVVHHINGDKLDNRLENLQILPSQADHARLHAQEVN